MQLIEITNEYTSFRSKSQIDRAELESLLEQEKLKVAQGLQTEELQRQLHEERYLRH